MNSEPKNWTELEKRMDRWKLAVRWFPWKQTFECEPSFQPTFLSFSSLVLSSSFPSLMSLEQGLNRSLHFANRKVLMITCLEQYLHGQELNGWLIHLLILIPHFHSTFPLSSRSAPPMFLRPLPLPRYLRGFPPISSQFKLRHMKWIKSESRGGNLMSEFWWKVQVEEPMNEWTRIWIVYLRYLTLASRSILLLLQNSHRQGWESNRCQAHHRSAHSSPIN